jgi:hypothetical protein
MLPIIRLCWQIDESSHSLHKGLLHRIWNLQLANHSVHSVNCFCCRNQKQEMKIIPKWIIILAT